MPRPTQTVHVRGRSVPSTFVGLATVALELPSGGIVVLQTRTLEEYARQRQAIQGTPLGRRFEAIGRMEPIPPRAGQRALLRVRAIDGKAVPEAQCGATWSSVATRAPLDDNPKLPVTLTLVGELVARQGDAVVAACGR